jgi:hypothetical protein
MTKPRPFPVKVFHRDHLIRDMKGIPIGRVILSGEYVPSDRIYCVLMTIPKSYMSDIKGKDFWIDGEKYQIAKDTPSIRFSGNKLEHRVNSFYLEKAIEKPIEAPSSQFKRVSRKTATRLAKENRSRIEAAMDSEVERDASVPGIIEGY